MRFVQTVLIRGLKERSRCAVPLYFLYSLYSITRAVKITSVFIYAHGNFIMNKINESVPPKLIHIVI